MVVTGEAARGWTRNGNDVMAVAGDAERRQYSCVCSAVCSCILELVHIPLCRIALSRELASLLSISSSSNLHRDTALHVAPGCVSPASSQHPADYMRSPWPRHKTLRRAALHAG